MKLYFTALFLFAAAICFAQDSVFSLAPSVKVYNYTSLTHSTERNVSDELISFSSPESQSHPEFGIRPLYATCDDCSEIIDRRTANSRYYIKNGTGGKTFYVQTSSADLHYKNNSGQWITIDPRISADPSNPLILHAPNQFNPTKLNLEEKYASIQMFNDWELKLNEHTKLTFDKNEIQTDFSTDDYTVGDDGSIYKNAWDGIDLVQTFGIGTITTDYVINNLNSFDDNSDYLILQEHLHLPSGYSIKYDKYEGAFLPSGLWEGDLLIVDEYDREYARYSGIVLYDHNPEKVELEDVDLTGYKIRKEDETYIVEIWVSNKWLTSEKRVFPITIDPLVSATTTWSGTIGSNFTPSYCDQIVTATLPGNATFTNGIFDWEIRTGNGCLSTCWLSDARVKIVTICGESPAGAFWWSCPGCDVGGLWDPSPAVNDPVPVTCFTPACADFTKDFTFRLLRIYNCGAATGCPTNCIKSLRYDVTVEGQTVSVTALAEGATSYTVVDCADQSGWLSCSSPNYGVSPYTYLWSTGATSSSTYVSWPMGVTVFTVTITDACGNTATDNVTVTNNCLVLPINLLSFTGYHQNGSNYLDWEADAGSNPNPFVVERSPNGLNFEQIGEIEINKQESNTNRYSFIDNAPFEGLSYYRLTRTENGESTSISDVIAIKASDIYTSQIIINDQNPVGDGVNLTVFSTQEGLHDLNLFDVTGKLISTRPVELIKGATTVTFQLPEVASGVYLFAISINGDLAEAKFIK